MSYEKTVKKVLLSAGIKINGKNSWDIQVHNPKFYRKILAEADIGLGEAYMDKWIDCNRIDILFEKIMNAELENRVKNKKKLIFEIIRSKLFNLQSISRAKKVGEVHYDVGNELYRYMLDKRMVYSCGYWKNLKKTAENLDLAQEQKLDLICKKIGLKKGMSVLDIGCGWGSFAKFAAEKYGARVVGITISKEQAKLAQERCKGLSVEIRLQDYRHIKEKFDRVVSVGMFEHVGRKNYKDYMGIVNNNLKDGGLFLLHTIGWKKTRKIRAGGWLDKYIFPNGEIPSAEQIAKAANGIFQLEDWHNFGHDYTTTLLAWHDNFVKNWDKIKKDYDERFYRMWIFYLLSCAGLFMSGTARLWQIVFSKDLKHEYVSVR